MSAARKVIVAVAVTIAALGLAGCGENQQVTVYKQGKYQGKPDQKPWDSPQYGGDQAKWERAIQTRTQDQNEYVRIGG
jgi:hypothetical protein